MEKLACAKDSPFPNSKYVALHTDGHLYLYSGSTATKFMTCMSVTGVFQHPLDLIEFSNCCDCSTPAPCFDIATTDYPIQPHFIDLIKREIVTELANLKQIQEDKVNDSDA
jgi:hypothetical protein